MKRKQRTQSLEMSMACARFVYKALTGKKVYDVYSEWTYLGIVLEVLVKEFGMEKVKAAAAAYDKDKYLNTNEYDI